MTEGTIQDWLTEWSGLDPSQVPSNVTVLEHNEDLIQAIHEVLEENTKYIELQSQVCDQLFSYYRSREAPLQNFTLQFLPTLMYSYLSSVAAGDKKGCRSVETLLLGIYNLEVVTETGEPAVFSFRLPSLVQSSIYHEPTRETITDAALRRFEEVNTKPVTWGPHPQTEVINAQNRLKVLTALLFVYNRNIALLHRPSLRNLCRSASRILTQGFPARNHQQSSAEGSAHVHRLPRIPVSSQFLLQLASALYYAMYNDFGYEGIQAINDMDRRGCCECYSDVILVVNAIKNSSVSYVSPTGQPADAPMGISCALSPATTTVTTVNKSMITNASFRTKKLPDFAPLSEAWCMVHIMLKDDLDPLDPTSDASGNGAGPPILQTVRRRRLSKWKGWSFFQATPEENETKRQPMELPRPAGLAMRRRSELPAIPSDFNCDLVRPLGSDSPKRRAMVSARQNGMNCSPNRVSAGARLCQVFDGNEMEV